MTTKAVSDAGPPFVLALDVGTSSVRAIVYDSAGNAVEGLDARTGYRMDLTDDGGVEIDADRLLGIIGATIDGCLERVRALPGDAGTRFCGVGYSNFWHALLGVGEGGEPVTPLYSWNDTRSAAEAAELAARIDQGEIHRRTGVIPHASYYPAKILWLRRTRPALAAMVRRWVSIGEYLYFRLFGRYACGVSMASGTGLFDPAAGEWNGWMMAELGIDAGMLSPLTGEGEGFSGLAGEYARRWPELAGVPWLPAAGDGACSNIGSGCMTGDSVAINVGTSGAMRVCWEADRIIPPRGLWFYRANRRYSLLGGALSNGGDVFEWCKRTLGLDGLDDDTIESRIAAIRPDGHGLTVLPFFSGERSTGWHDSARASIVGLDLGAGPFDILRASLESVCYRFAAIYDLLRGHLPRDNRIIASGGGILNSEVWTQMMADVIGVPVAASAVAEASSRGAAMLALEAFAGTGGLESFPIPLGRVYDPDPGSHDSYRAGRMRQEKFYKLLVD